MEEKKETMTASQPEQQATPKDKKEKRTFSRKKRVIVYLAVFSLSTVAFKFFRS